MGVTARLITHAKKRPLLAVQRHQSWATCDFLSTSGTTAPAVTGSTMRRRKHDLRLRLPLKLPDWVIRCRIKPLRVLLLAHIQTFVGALLAPRAWRAYRFLHIFGLALKRPDCHTSSMMSGQLLNYCNLQPMLMELVPSEVRRSYRRLE